LSNDWVLLTIVPQLGGRLMQVTFAGHSYLFVNPQYKGQYFPPPGRNKGKWFTYGGDKLWPLPEGRQDEQHWAGPASDMLDDGEYQLTVLSHDSTCAVRLDGPADPVTGLQYSREISIGSDSPQISFHAVMKNATGHPIRWSVQSVTQYDTADSTGKASVNFYKNGAALDLDDKGLPHLRSSTREDTPYYMEAEINSPMILLAPGESYAMDTQWFPTRAGKDLKDVTNAGIIERP